MSQHRGGAHAVHDAHADALARLSAKYVRDVSGTWVARDKHHARGTGAVGAQLGSLNKDAVAAGRHALKPAYNKLIMRSQSPTAKALPLARSEAKQPPHSLHDDWLPRPLRRGAASRPRTSLDVTEARAEFDGEKRRAHAVSGEVGYAIAGLWVRYPKPYKPPQLSCGLQI